MRLHSLERRAKTITLTIGNMVTLRSPDTMQTCQEQQQAHTTTMDSLPPRIPHLTHMETITGILGTEAIVGNATMNTIVLHIVHCTMSGSDCITLQHPSPPMHRPVVLRAILQAIPAMSRRLVRHETHQASPQHNHLGRHLHNLRSNPPPTQPHCLL